MSHLLKTRSDDKTKQNAASPEEQQRKINEVRELLGDLASEMPRFLTDGTIRRFLRARSWSKEQATKALKETVKWRRQYRPDKICWDDLAGRENEATRAYLPDYRDKNGRTVFVIMTSRKSKTSTKEHIRQLVYNLENMSMDSEDAQEENIVWMCDFRGWTLSSTPFWETRESLYIIQNYYPGLIALAVLSNPPKIFESFWKMREGKKKKKKKQGQKSLFAGVDRSTMAYTVMIKHFLEPKLQEKVKFVYNNNSESQRIMADMFDLDKLESAFGGRNTDNFDIIKYAERMRKRDQIRGACTQENGNTSTYSHD
ncbi:hypothetical protein ACP4OV_015975 [Aristida adscensionis]